MRLLHLFLFLLCLAPVAAAQEPAEPSPGSLRVTTHTSVVRRHKPGYWSLVGVSADNTTDEAAEAMVAIYFEPDVGRQYARRMWVPPQSRRTAWLPIAIPGNVPGERVRFTALTIDTTSGRELLQRREGEQLTSEVTLSIDREAGKTGVYFPRMPPVGGSQTERLNRDAYQTIMAAKISMHLPHTATDFSENFLPPWSEVLKGFEQILLASDRITGDTAGITNLRDWVRGGGRLWIMLDRIDPSTVSAIVGSAINLQVVDRVELDRYTLETVATSSQEAAVDACEYEVPVDLVRVITSSGDVSHRVNGWPAAIWLPYGEGEILLTTLDPRGWRKDNMEDPTQAVKHLGARFYSSREGRLDVKAFRPALEEQIGYEIPRRWFATTLLGGYCLSLLAAGLVLGRIGRLDRLAWIIPAATAFTTAVFIAVGAANTTSVPQSIAVTQLLRVSPHTNEAHVDALAAIYDRQSREISLQGRERGWLIAEPSSDSQVRRHVWTDQDDTQTQNVSTLAGSISLASISTTRDLSKHVAARAAFGPEGLAGQLTSGELSDVSDVIIVSPPAPALAVHISPDGSFTAGPDQVLAADQFSDSALLTQEQRRRQDICRRLLDPTDTFVFPRQASLLFWCQPLEAGVAFPEAYGVSGSAVAVLPLEFDRTPPGTRFQIPVPFLKMDVASSVAYQRRTGQWIKGLTRGSKTVLQFSLPEQVLPCRLDRGTLTVRISAPNRQLEVWSRGGAQPVLVRSVRNPSGVLQFDLQEGQLALDDQGRVELEIAVSEVTKPESGGVDVSQFDNSTWQIDYVRLTVAGVTQ